MYNITKDHKVYKAVTCYGIGNFKTEPWHHLVFDDKTGTIIIFVWDTRQVVYEATGFDPQMHKSVQPGTWLKANDNGEPLQNCKLQRQINDNLEQELDKWTKAKEASVKLDGKLTDEERRDTERYIKYLTGAKSTMFLPSDIEIDQHIANLKKQLNQG